MMLLFLNYDKELKNTSILLVSTKYCNVSSEFSDFEAIEFLIEYSRQGRVLLSEAK